jgi:hypothetical protein
LPTPGTPGLLKKEKTTNKQTNKTREGILARDLG